MDKQQDGVPPILAADLNPLPDAADVDELSLLQPMRCMDRENFRREMLAVGTKAQPGGCHRNEDARCSQQ